MKPLLMAHGEKIFLALVILLGGYLLVGALGSLQKSTSLGEKDRGHLEDVQGAITKNRPPELGAPGHVAHMAKSFAGRTEPVKLATGRLMAPTWGYTKGVTIGQPTVTAVFPRPSGFTAKADRGKVTLTWLRPLAQYVKLERFEVYRQVEDKRDPEVFATVEADQESKSFEFVDTKVEPETSYSYFVRVVGSPQPASENQVVVKPPFVEEREGKWLPREAGPASASTPSNLAFACKSIYDDFGRKRARIIIKKWNAGAASWEVYNTGPGIAESEPVVGKRVVRFRPETFDSGYVVAKIFSDTERRPYTAREMDPQTFETREVTRYREIPVNRVTLRKEDKEITIQVGAAESSEVTTRRRPSSRPAEPAANDLLASMRAQLESRSGGGSTTETESTAASGDTKDFSSNNIFKLKVPKNWQDMGEAMLGNMPYGDPVVKDLKDGFDKALAGSVPDSALVIHHHALKNDEYREFVKGGEADANEEATLKRVGEELLLKRMKRAIPDATVMGTPGIIKPDNGPGMAKLVFKVQSGDTWFIVTRYCMQSLPNLHLMSCICRESDYETQRDVYDTVAKSFSF